MLASCTSAPSADRESTAVTSNGTKARRAPNWGPEEDEQLAKSWNLVSKDPNESNYDFWNRVLSDFLEHSVGPQRDASGLATRWKALQKGCLKFTAIYNRIKDSPPSGSSPEDWLFQAKQLYFEDTTKQFFFERPWNLLKVSSKFKQLMAKATDGGCVHSIQPQTQLNLSQQMEGSSDAANTPSPVNTPGISWKSKECERPPGFHSAKRKWMNEEEYRRKKMKLLESSYKEAVKRSAEAKRSNDIQDKLTTIEREKMEINLMFQDPANCPDEISRQFLMAQKKKIFDKIIGQPFKNTQDEPHLSNKFNGVERASSATSGESDHEESDEESNENNDEN